MVEDNLKLLIVAGSSLGIYIVLRTLIFPLLKRIAKKTNTIIDDLFLEKKFLNRVSFVAVFTFLNGILFTDFSTELLVDSEDKTWQDKITKVLNIESIFRFFC